MSRLSYYRQRLPNTGLDSTSPSPYPSSRRTCELSTLMQRIELLCLRWGLCLQAEGGGPRVSKMQMQHLVEIQGLKGAIG